MPEIIAFMKLTLVFAVKKMRELSGTFAYDDDRQVYFGYIAECLKRYTSQCDK